MLGGQTIRPTITITEITIARTTGEVETVDTTTIITTEIRRATVDLGATAREIMHRIETIRTQAGRLTRLAVATMAKTKVGATIITPKIEMTNSKTIDPFPFKQSSIRETNRGNDTKAR